MTANVITYRGRSAAREVGKVLGFDAATLDRLASLVGHFEYKDESDTLEAQFRTAGFNMRDPRIRKFLELCVRLQDLPRHLGQHSGGMVICQGQLDSVVPLEPAAMSAQRRAVGQRRLRGHGHREGRPARAWHDGGIGRLAETDPRSLW